MAAMALQLPCSLLLAIPLPLVSSSVGVGVEGQAIPS